MPRGLRPLGIVFLVVGGVILFLKYKFNLKPDFLDLKVFAFYSFYIESRSFTMITHQMLGEIAGFLVLSGLFILAFTREEQESDMLDTLRLKTFLITAYLNLFYLLISVFFFFGFGFVGALTLFMVFGFAAYIIVFRYLLYRSKMNQ